MYVIHLYKCDFYLLSAMKSDDLTREFILLTLYHLAEKQSIGTSDVHAKAEKRRNHADDVDAQLNPIAHAYCVGEMK